MSSKSKDVYHLICIRCRKPTISITPKMYEYLGHTRCSYCNECLYDGLKALKEKEQRYEKTLG